MVCVIGDGVLDCVYVKILVVVEIGIFGCDDRVEYNWCYVFGINLLEIDFFEVFVF